MTRRQAIDIAISSRGKADAGSLLSVGPLPEGVKDLLHVVAEGEWRAPSTEHVYARHSVAEIRAASAAFLTSALFHRKADPYRTLGLAPGAKPEDIRENKRLLLKWLHPDRNPDPRERAYLGQVIEAAEAIEGTRAKPGERQAIKPPPIVVAPRAKATRRPRPSKLHQAASQLAEGAAHTGKLVLGVSAAALVSLVAWRYVMNEPIGTSLERYAKLAQAMISW
jgi:hypothetical protein